MCGTSSKSLTCLESHKESREWTGQKQYLKKQWLRIFQIDERHQVTNLRISKSSKQGKHTESYTRTIIVKLLKIKDETEKFKNNHIFKERISTIQLMADRWSQKTMKWHLQSAKRKYPANLKSCDQQISFKNDGKINVLK